MAQPIRYNKRFKKRKFGMKIALWIVQFLVALFFLAAGTAKVFTPMDDLLIMLPWTGDVPSALVRFIYLRPVQNGG